MILHRGYAVSKGETNDGFAILKPEVFLSKKKAGGKTDANKKKKYYNTKKVIND
jgi:hypothetical protein